jgi:hypothetical protein
MDVVIESPNCHRRTPEYRWQGQMEISENLAYMYRQKIKKFSNAQIAACISPNCQFLLRLPIWPQKTPKISRLGH